MASEQANTPHMTSRWPEQWRTIIGVGRILVPASAATLGVFLVVAGVWALSMGEPIGLLCLTFAPLPLSGVAASYLERNVSPRRTASALEGSPQSVAPHVFIPCPRVEIHVRQATNFSFFLMFATLPFIMNLVPDDGSREYGRMQAVSLVAPVFAVWAAAYVLSGLVRRGRRMGVALSPKGVHHTWWFGMCFYPWASIRALEPRERPRLTFDLVVDARGMKASDPSENRISALPSFRRKMTRIHAGALAVNPALALHALRFYLAHPHLRDELGTDAGLERIRSADLTTDSTPVASEVERRSR